MRKTSLLAALAACVSAAATAAWVKESIRIYPSLMDASRHCRSTVVWLNTKTGIYHMPGSRDYGATREGAYACQATANKAGARPAANAQ